MKQLFCLLLSLVLLSGCSLSGERIKEPVRFYYLRTDYQYGVQDGLIAAEEREAAGHRDDLAYLLALYRIGPSSEELRSPIPQGLAFKLAQQTPSEITLTLGSNTMTDADFSLACACLALTCMELTAADQVTITSDTRSLTITQDNLILFDSSIAVRTEETP